MRILLISPLCPLPLEKGGAVRVWNIARELSKVHTVDLLCLIRDEKEWRYETELKTVFRNVQMLKRREIVSPRVLLEDGWQKVDFFVKNMPLLWRCLISGRPLVSVLYEHEGVERYVRLADLEREYDLMYVETYYAAASLREELCYLKTPLLLCEQNVEYEAYGRQADQQNNMLVKWLMWVDVWKMRWEEILFWKRAQRLAGLSTVDVRLMKEATERADVGMIENGVDIEWFEQFLVERVENEVLFVGSFSYFPNVDALRWLVDEIWPEISKNYELRTKNKDAISLRIVGRGADDSLKDYVRSKGLEIDESVEDIREAYQRASVLIAPIRAGSGTKYKVLEALASHCPVVTTSVGAEGLDVQSGSEMIIEDDAQGLAEAVVEVLMNKEKAKKLAEIGIEFVRSRYDWKEIISNFKLI